ncbi:hypothetical protein D0Y65_036917, partial [Glycine soja]
RTSRRKRTPFPSSSKLYSSVLRLLLLKLCLRLQDMSFFPLNISWKLYLRKLATLQIQDQEPTRLGGRT